MAGSVNKVILVGNVGKDPEIRVAQNGTKFAELILATSETWRDKATGEKKEKTEWHRIIVFSEGLVANVISTYVKKGVKLYIEGSLQTRKWVDAQQAEHYVTEIVLQNYSGVLIILDSKSARTNGGQFGQPAASSLQTAEDNEEAFVEEEIDDSIPF